MSTTAALDPFENQTRVERLLVIAGGIAACLIGYVVGASVFVGFDALAHDAPVASRRIAAVFASMACWGYYTVAFIRGKGGPITNIVIYPTITLAVAPWAFRWLVFGPAWEALSGRFGFVLIRTAVFVDVAVYLVPGVLFCTGLLALWASRLGEDGVRVWQARHLSPAFRAEFIESFDEECNEVTDGADTDSKARR